MIGGGGSELVLIIFCRNPMLVGMSVAYGKRQGMDKLNGCAEDQFVLIAVPHALVSCSETAPLA